VDKQHLANRWKWVGASYTKAKEKSTYIAFRQVIMVLEFFEGQENLIASDFRTY